VKIITLPAQLRRTLHQLVMADISGRSTDQHQACVPAVFCSERELGRGDREVWGSVGDNQIGIIHSAAMPVKYGYDTVLDNDADNEQVSNNLLLQHVPFYFKLTQTMQSAASMH